MSKKLSTIYELLSDYSEEEINEMISNLSDEEKNYLRKDMVMIYIILSLLVTGMLKKELSFILF
ncbi:MAG: hypothetical protein IJI43_00505 [Bacilli bacterium]|nr:hypothetical protein [Bacilli bacterium]